MEMDVSWELKLDKWIHFTQGEGREEGTLGTWHDILKSICWGEWSVSQTFLERFLEADKKK